MPNGNSLRQQVENNVALFLLGALFTGFVAGWGAYATVLKVNDRETIGTDRRKVLESFEKQIKDRDSALTSSGSGKPGPVMHTVSPLPEYTRAVDSLLTSLPQDNYQWDGYRADVDELHRLVDRFLDYLWDHPDTTYAQAQSFYAAIDEAASVVTLNAQKTFAWQKENPLTEPYDPRLPNYNQKVFIGPSWFRIRVEELRKEHKRGSLTRDLIRESRRNFNEWRQKEGI